MKNVVVYIKRGKGERACYTYASIRDAKTGEVLVSATLEYVTMCLGERDYKVIDIVLEG